jgi:hypothetical protein
VRLAAMTLGYLAWIRETQDPDGNTFSACQTRGDTRSSVRNHTTEIRDQKVSSQHTKYTGVPLVSPVIFSLEGCEPRLGSALAEPVAHFPHRPRMEFTAEFAESAEIVLDFPLRSPRPLR